MGVLIRTVSASRSEGEDDVGHLVGGGQFLGGDEAEVDLQLPGRLAALALEGIPALELLLVEDVLDADGHAAHKVGRHDVLVLDAEVEGIGLVAEADVEGLPPRGVEIVVDDGGLDEPGRLLATGDRVDGHVRVGNVLLATEKVDVDVGKVATGDDVEFEHTRDEIGGGNRHGFQILGLGVVDGVGGRVAAGEDHVCWLCV